jgi:hypothetical protein
MFALGKEHYKNLGKTKVREITGGIEWRAIVRNNLDLYTKRQVAKIVAPPTCRLLHMSKKSK